MLPRFALVLYPPWKPLKIKHNRTVLSSKEISRVLSKGEDFRKKFKVRKRQSHA